MRRLLQAEGPKGPGPGHGAKPGVRTPRLGFNPFGIIGISASVYIYAGLAGEAWEMLGFGQANR